MEVIIYVQVSNCELFLPSFLASFLGTLIYEQRQNKNQRSEVYCKRYLFDKLNRPILKQTLILYLVRKGLILKSERLLNHLVKQWPSEHTGRYTREP